MEGGDQELDPVEVDIENYVPDAQPYITQALEDPASVGCRDLREVATVITTRAWEDSTYPKTAAKMCRVIAVKEYRQQQDMSVPSYTFQHSVVSSCMELFADFKAMRQCNRDYWCNFVRFLSYTYTLMTMGNKRLTALTDLLYDVLTVLASEPLVHETRELQLLASVLHHCGYDLQTDSEDRMQKLMVLVRDACLQPSANAKDRTILLPVIEKQAGCWQLYDNAAKFHKLTA